jgi:Na+-translocating ferredoxin:NAD+ oxidoreductase RnfD subunit
MKTERQEVGSQTQPTSAPAKPAGPPRIEMSRRSFALRAASTALLITGYYFVRQPFADALQSIYTRFTEARLDPATPRVIAVSLLLASLVLVWRKIMLRDPRFHAPILITAILALGNAAFNILENQPAPSWLVKLTGGAILEYSPTFIAILTTILVEIVVGRFFWGKWPHLASAYISGISIGILIKSSELWPFVLCGLISILSKYVLRIGKRHLWNPTNFGVTMMLFLAYDHVASLSVQAGNNGIALIVIWILGAIIMYRLRIIHIPLTFVAAFIPLAFLRSYFTGQPWQTEIAPITSPMFQLFIFFMITDPKTTTRGWKRQTIVALLVACMETYLRLQFLDKYSLYHSLFIVGPIANLVEMYFDRRAQLAAQAYSPPVEKAVAEPEKKEKALQPVTGP